MDPEERKRLERIVAAKRAGQGSTMDPEERKKLERIAADKRMMQGPVTEDEGMAIATRAAERKYEETAPGLLETAAGQFAQGLTFGTVDEAAAFLAKEKGWSYDDAKKKINLRLMRQRITNPKTAFTADVLGSIVSSLIPGLGVARGAKLAHSASKGAKFLNAAKHLGKQSGKQGLIGFGEGFARGEGDDRLRNAATTGIVTAASPGAMELFKGAGKLAKGVIPGSTTSPRILNKSIAGLSKMTSKLDDDGAKAYQEMLDSPEILQKAFTSPKEAQALAPQMNEALSKTFKSIDKMVKSQYDKKQIQAFTKNVDEVDEFLGLLGNYQQNIEAAMDEVQSMSKFYSPKTMGFLERVQDVIGLKDPKVGDLAAKLEKLQREAAEAGATGNAEALQRISNEYREQLPKLGGALVRARRYLDEGITFKRGESTSDDQRLLTDLREKIQVLTHEISRGSKEMAEADKLYSTYKTQAAPFIEQFKGRGPDDMSAKKVGDFISGAGSVYKQAEIKGYHDAAVDFLRKNGMEEQAKGLSDTITKFDQMRNRLEFGRVGGQTGATTGRSTLPYITAGVGAAIGEPTIGITLGILSTPILAPTTYASALNTIRKQIASAGESAVAQKFGPAWPAIKTALSRRIATQDDVREAAESIKAATGDKASELFQKGQNLDTGAIPDKIKTYLKGSNNNQGAAIAPSRTPNKRKA